jgi:hypothetical protein
LPWGNQAGNWSDFDRWHLVWYELRSWQVLTGIASGNNEVSHAGPGISGAGATVAVIIPTFNHARFLAEAIMSVLAQTRPPEEIMVVDDGSTDDPANVVAQFPTVQFIRQDNRGVSAARNKGLRSCMTSHVIFLDADDRLLPTAIEAGLACCGPARLRVRLWWASPYFGGWSGD